jgi:hypothetical protein
MRNAVIRCPFGAFVAFAAAQDGEQLDAETVKREPMHGLTAKVSMRRAR